MGILDLRAQSMSMCDSANERFLDSLSSHYGDVGLACDLVLEILTAESDESDRRVRVLLLGS